MVFSGQKFSKKTLFQMADFYTISAPEN